MINAEDEKATKARIRSVLDNTKWFIRKLTSKKESDWEKIRIRVQIFKRWLSSSVGGLLHSIQIIQCISNLARFQEGTCFKNILTISLI